MSYTIIREESLIPLSLSDDSNLPQNLTEKSADQFDNFLIESIDEVLSLLGAPVKNELYLRLEVNFNMEKNDIPKRLEEFSYILHRVFNLEASRLEVKVLKNLDSKIPKGSKCINEEWTVSMWIEKDMSFINSINAKRKEFLDSE
jgi:hypothetical protein